ncbi:MAG: hypothetical protein Faunusvirus13_24 [Faunusvirus sp.]|uniref:Uncharacterized protein n=1 Tax=Faunusvirus sp. TaxID=2487766 RepID=A0A3G4ZZJ7_9VIRU|nr:MAG: hypothetical protein Faunusvirus13_24 [Faunusvirus sp.]
MLEAKKYEFLKLVIESNEDKCIEYINRNDDFFNIIADNFEHSNMLQMTCMYKLNKVAIALIDKKCNLTYQDTNGWSAIIYATWYRLENIAEYIIDKVTDITTRSTVFGLSEMMYILRCGHIKNVIKMINRGYNIYHKNNINNSIFTDAIDFRSNQVVKKLIDIDTNFIDEFNTIYHNPELKRDEFYYDITKYCADKRDGYKHKIIATMNDASPANALYQSFHTTYAVQLVDIICDFILLKI